MTDSYALTGVPRSDFPDETVHHDGFLGWGFVGFVVAVAVIGLYVFYRMGRRSVADAASRAIDENVKSLLKPVQTAASARPEALVERAEASREAFDATFGRTFALASAFSKASKGVKGAVEGLKDSSEGAKPAAVASLPQGGTLISIAVNQANAMSCDGEAVAASGVTAGPAKPAAETVTEEQPVALWKAVQKLFDELRTRTTITTALKAAQQQLLYSPQWIRPKEDGEKGEAARS